MLVGMEAHKATLRTHSAPGHPAVEETRTVVLDEIATFLNTFVKKDGPAREVEEEKELGEKEAGKETTKPGFKASLASFLGTVVVVFLNLMVIVATFLLIISMVDMYVGIA